MDITWHGRSCFTIKGKNLTVVTNPNKEAKGLKGEVILSSSENPIEVEGSEKVFDWPGEYEIKEIPIIGFQAWTKSKSKEEEEKAVGEPTILFYFEIDGIKCLHLGDLGHILTSEIVNEIGDVDILMIKCGSNSNLAAKKAVEVIEEIDPRALIPMGDGNFEAVLKELGVSNAESEDKFSIKSASELPDDKRAYVILNKA